MKYPLRDYAPHAVNIVIQHARQTVDTILTHIKVSWWGVQLGERIKFFGVPIIRRHPTARIIIGDDSIFRSAQWSNTIGLNRPCIISARRGATIAIGHHCGFSGAVIAADTFVTIGNRVLCGGNCTIVDTDRHPIDADARARQEKADAKPIVIEDDVFLSMNVVVLKGSIIGKGTVVAANSVVTGSLPGGVIAGGVPARVIRVLDRDNRELKKGYSNYED